MEKKTAGLVGAIASLATMGAAQAAVHPAQTPEQVMRVSSYAELLTPIPNAAELLRQAQMQPRPVQYYQDEPPPPPDYYHHHHHHHHYYPPPPPYHHHHHHHHHHGGVTLVVPGVGVLHSGN